MKPTSYFYNMGLSSNLVEFALANQILEKANSDRLSSFFESFSHFIECNNKDIYNTMIFPKPTDITHFCYRVPITSTSGGLLSLHGVNELSFSMPPDRGSTTLEIAFMSNGMMVYLDEYGPETSFFLPTFDVYNFHDIMQHLVAIHGWVEGNTRPDSDED
jgi:hypothetical protein